MPPKRSRASSSKTKPRTTPKGASSSASAKRSRRTYGLFKHPRQSDEDEDEEDSEKEIETVKDYEDAVRRRMLTSTTNRYDDSMDQDHLAYAASLMMPVSDLQRATTALVKDQQYRPEAGRIVYSLGTFCLHAISKDFKYLAADPSTPTDPALQQSQRIRSSSDDKTRVQRTGAMFRKQVQRLPYYLSTKLFKLLKHARPELLSARIWTTLFFPASNSTNDIGGSAGPFITEVDLEGLIASQVTDTVIRHHILGNLDLGPQLEKINLNHQDGLSDKVMSHLVGSCPNLTRLLLKGCSKVGDLTLASLPQDSLQELNISFVAAPTTKGIKQMLLQCRKLRVLKIVGLVNVKDVLFLDLEKELDAEKGSDKLMRPRPLHQLQNLKISRTKLGDRGLKALLGLIGRSIRRLDISDTIITRLSIVAQFCIWEEEGHNGSQRNAFTTRLEKLNITRLKLVSPTDLLSLFKRLPPHSLHTLLMGYLTCGQVPIWDDLIHQLCPYLEPDSDPNQDVIQMKDKPVPLAYSSDPFAPMPVIEALQPDYHLHTFSLFGNPQIGKSKRLDYGIHLLLKRLAPYLRRLELGYTHCKASILEGLLVVGSDNLDPSSGETVGLADNFVLEELGLDETPIDDDASSVLSRFRRLVRLSIANTRIGQEAVESVVESCPLLTSLDLTSCRAIPVLNRRTLLKDTRTRLSAATVTAEK
ncbi:hypothetical protein BGX28_009726 [Mortierella sp. GBA30]|nr:hypothetical protein BGX28_009726 [Mortierella sp. GBA30]